MIEDKRYDFLEFIDDYRLLVNLGSSKDDLPCIMLVDTEKNVEGAPVQTSFHLPEYYRRFQHPFLLLERGMHKPSPAECLAPFYQDRTQRIVVLSAPYGYLVFPVEPLLRLAEDREGCKIGWDEWLPDVTVTISNPRFDLNLVVSGCRLFCMASARPNVDIEVEMYDFSMQGRTKYLREMFNTDSRYLASTGTNAGFPFHADSLVSVSGGHDSVAFYEASVPLFSCAMRLSDVV